MLPRTQSEQFGARDTHSLVWVTRTLEEAREKASAKLEGSSGPKRVQRELFVNSVDLAIADAYVAQGNYDEATRVLENSDAEQAPAILELLYINPEEYRESVLNSEL